MTVETDAIVLFLHRCECEAVVFLQSELERFFVSLGLLFDYTKSTKSFDTTVAIANELELTLPVKNLNTNNNNTSPAKQQRNNKNEKNEKSKEKDHNNNTAADKKNKKNVVTTEVFVPYREPFAPLNLPKNEMLLLPTNSQKKNDVEKNNSKETKPKEKKVFIYNYSVSEFYYLILI
jgi:hypothetical protein